jgi:hypothetical protein
MGSMKVNFTLRTGKAMHVLRTTEARSRKQVCRGKAIRITHSECDSLALSMQHAMRMSHVVICGLPGCTVFFTSFHKRQNLGKMLLSMNNMSWFSLKFCLKHFSP